MVGYSLSAVMEKYTNGARGATNVVNNAANSRQEVNCP